ncbi:HET-domain-containing protein, partial [Wilcoxina mikolae CBS 423.85]
MTLVDVAPLIRINRKDLFSYAALSHTWGSEEVIYSDLESGATLDQLDSKQEGQEKLLGSVNAAKELGLKYIWADTCCIDKANYTELAESLASMGQWYTNADVCVVYLGDYPVNPEEPSEYEGTRWSSRGWTLQEIVLCRKAVFYNASWTKIASSGSQSDQDISRICSLPSDTVCLGRAPQRAASDILSWAAKRKTTKPEDGAYSLMGILDTVITIRYGEGLERALSRLIEAVVREKGDVTVFNW